MSLEDDAMKNEGESDPKVNSEIGRFEQIESTLDEFRNRLNRIERRLGTEPAPRAAAPPVPPPARPEPPPLPRFDFKSYSPPNPPAEPAPNEDAELKFGSVVLPRVGAAVVLLGIAYLVGLGIAGGWITVWHQFWGAAALCIASIGIGLWKRAEGHDFGQVLIGLGSCGLYLTFAGGHAFLKLYEAEALVAQFLVLSLLNLAYGGWSPSKSFVGIGLLGGLAAALMPMQRSNVELSLTLHMAILVPTVLIVAHRKWPQMAMGAWFVSTAAMLWPVLTKGVWPWQLAALYGASLLAIAAYSWSNEDWDFDAKHAFVPFAALVTGLIALAGGGVARETNTAHLLTFGAALALIGAASPREKARNALWLAGLLAPFAFAPIGLVSLFDAWAYVGLAAVAAALSFRMYPRTMFGLTLLGLAMGGLMYFARLSGPISIGVVEESLFLLAGMATMILATVSLSKRMDEAEIATFVSALAIAPALGRLSIVLLGQPSIGASIELALWAAAMPLAGAAAILAMRKGWSLIAGLAWLALGGAGLAYMGTFERSPLTGGLEVFVLASMLATTLLCCLSIPKVGSEPESAGVVAALTIWPIFTRLGYVLATDPAVGMAGSAAVTLTWTLYAVMVLIAGFALDFRSTRIAGLSIFGITLGKVLIYDLSALDPGIRVALLILLGMAMIGGGYWYVHRTRPGSKPPAVTA